MSSVKYLDYDGLKHFWENVQDYVDDGDTSVTVQSSDNSITVVKNYDADSDGDVDGINIQVNIDNSTIKQDDDNQLYVVNALSDGEKGWIEEQLFDTLFTCTISRSATYVIFLGSSTTVTWTLTTTYDGDPVDLDEVPSGWTRTGTGTYTKTSTISSTTGSSVSSGSVTCYYTPSSTQFSKTASSVSCTNVKYSYIYCTTDESISSLDSVDFDSATMMNTSTATNTISGSKSITFEADQYAYFIVANTSSLSSVTQLGLSYINSSYSSLTRTNYGTYKVYRSINAMGAGTQSVTVA